MTERKLIKDYERLHASGDYGSTGYKALPFMLSHIMALAPGSLIDYGCGQSDLAARLARKAGILVVAGYDPAIAELSAKPAERFDLLTNVDVLEHIPEEELDAVIGEMASMARHAIIVIDTAPARTFLSDGRNAHVSLHDEAEWLRRLKVHFPTIRPIRIRRHSRVAFKTWAAEAGSLASRYVEGRERLLVLASKFRRLFPG